MSGISLNALLFFISAIFDLYSFILILRFFLALAGAEYSHPLTQFVTNMTNVIISPLRKVTPDFHRIELASLLLLLLLAFIKFFIIITLSYGLPNLVGIAILAVGDTIKLVIELLSFVFLLQLIMYWLQPLSPINPMLAQLTGSLMHPLEQAFAPRGTGYLWIAWALAFVLLQLIIILLANPLLAHGLKTAVA